jgi:palmitoyltransferase
MWNTTTIEEWEIERHETLLHRAKVTGGILDGPDGIKVRIQRQEFPYDIGVWKNLSAGMGTANVRLKFIPFDASLIPIKIMAWFWPFYRSFRVTSRLEFETNGFEGGTPWLCYIYLT